jgi:propanol-preferring alcohol dehydrogenase
LHLRKVKKQPEIFARQRPLGHHESMLPTTIFAMTADPSGHRLLGGFKPAPKAGDHDVLVRMLAYGVCRTDLHIIDGDLPPHRPGVVPGHEVVRQIIARGAQASRFAVGQRVGIPWLGGTCGGCAFCAMQRENLCDFPVFTGYDRDGGFAEYAGLIGFRAWRLAGEAAPRRLGLYGFGAAHIVCQIAVSQQQQVHAFTQPGDAAGQRFARSLGAAWAGGSDERGDGTGSLSARPAGSGKCGIARLLQIQH